MAEVREAPHRAIVPAVQRGVVAGPDCVRSASTVAFLASGVDLDLAEGPGYSFETTEDLLREFDANVAKVRATLTAATDLDFAGTWNVRAGADIYETAGRKDALRNTINHFVHHRGQLTVYLRLLDVPIPQLYGPTADET
jgi:hypothetical protein